MEIPAARPARGGRQSPPYDRGRPRRDEDRVRESPGPPDSRRPPPRLRMAQPLAPAAQASTAAELTASAARPAPAARERQRLQVGQAREQRCGALRRGRRFGGGGGRWQTSGRRGAPPRQTSPQVNPDNRAAHRFQRRGSRWHGPDGRCAPTEPVPQRQQAQNPINRFARSSTTRAPIRPGISQPLQPQLRSV